MKQNTYNDPAFFAKYAQIPRSVDGLAAAGEWPAFRSLLPDLQGARVLDLGCGYGWHCRYAAEQGASTVVGIDLSAQMIAKAQSMTTAENIRFVQTAIEDFASEPVYGLALESRVFFLHGVNKADANVYPASGLLPRHYGESALSVLIVGSAFIATGSYRFSESRSDRLFHVS